MLAEALNQQLPVQVNQSSYRVYIKDGIMYHEFDGEFSLDAALGVQEQAFAMLREKDIQLIPLIVYLNGVDKAKFNLHMKDYARAVTSMDFIRHASDIWLVDTKGQLKTIANIVNTVFFGGRMHLVDSLKQAQEGAHAAIAERDPILEKGT